MPPFTLDHLDSLRFHAGDLATLRRLGEYRGRQELFARQRPEVLAALRTVAQVESAESSNRLEGIEAPKERIEALVLHETRPANRSEQEIAGYRDALDLIHQSAREMPLTPNVILQIHRTIYGYLPQDGGRWKSTDNEIVERAPDGEIVRVRFRPLAAVSTPGAMDELATRYRTALDDGGHDALVLIPALVLDFLCIHPFTDGNGRVARLLTLQLLYRAGYDVGRYISLERLFETAWRDYYETLEASSRGWHEGRHDPFPWMRYSWGVLLKAYQEFEDRVGAIAGGKGGKTRQVRAAVERKVAPFAISELQRDCPGVSKEMIRHVLSRMRDEGLVILEGRGRGARWRRVAE
jgi:Fic family protein